MSYKTDQDSIVLEVKFKKAPVYNQESKITTLTEKVALFANVSFEYLEHKYYENVLINELYEVDRDAVTGNLDMTTFTVVTDPTTITKADIDNAIDTAIQDHVDIIDGENQYKVLLEKAKSTNYPYPSKR